MGALAPGRRRRARGYDTEPSALASGGKAKLKITQTSKGGDFTCFDGPEGWEAADAAYYASEERLAIAPEPTRHLVPPTSGR